MNIIYHNNHHLALIRGIRNALYDTIRAHGPITKNYVPSAIKRIFGAIKCHAKNFRANTGCSNNKWLEIYKQNYLTKITDDGNITIPWSDFRSIVDKCIERGEYLSLLAGQTSERSEL